MVDKFLGEAQAVIARVVAVATIIHKDETDRAVVIARGEQLLHVRVAGLRIVLNDGVSVCDVAWIAVQAVDNPCVVVLACQLPTFVQHGFDDGFLGINISVAIVTLRPQGTLPCLCTIALCAEHVVDVGLVVAPAGNHSAVYGTVIFVAAEEKYLAARLADGEVGAEGNEEAAEACQSRLHLVGEVVIAAVAFSLVTDEYDTELRRMVGDVVAQLSHYAVEGITGLEYTMIDVQLIIGSDVE